MAGDASFDVVSDTSGAMGNVELYACGGPCSTNPRSVCTGPPKKTGEVFQGAISSLRSMRSNRVSSVSSVGHSGRPMFRGRSSGPGASLRAA